MCSFLNQSLGAGGWGVGLTLGGGRLWVPGPVGARKTSLSDPGPTLDTPPPQSPCIPVLWVLSTQPGPWMLTASQDKESYVPHSWFPGAYSVTAPEGSLRNFLPE